VPCCVDLKRFNGIPGERERSVLCGKSQDKFIFMYLGKLGTWYMLSEMVDFFSFALNKLEKSVFVILTQDPLGGLTDIINKKRLDISRFRFIKPEFNDIPKYLPLASAGIFFINPYMKFGSSPIKLGEFLASRVPVIINSGIGDSDILVKEQRVGVVVDSFHREHFSRALDELLNLKRDPGLPDRCRNCASEHLSLESGVKKYWSIYSSVIK